MAIQIHEIEGEKTDVDLDGVDIDILLGSVREGLKCFEFTGFVVNSNNFAFKDEAGHAITANFWYESNEVWILLGHDFEVAGEDGDFAMVVTMYLGTLAVVLEFATEVTAL